MISFNLMSIMKYSNSSIRSSSNNNPIDDSFLLLLTQSIFFFHLSNHSFWSKNSTNTISFYWNKSFITLISIFSKFCIFWVDNGSIIIIIFVSNINISIVWSTYYILTILTVPLIKVFLFSCPLNTNHFSILSWYSSYPIIMCSY